MLFHNEKLKQKKEPDGNFPSGYISLKSPNPGLAISE